MVKIIAPKQALMIFIGVLILAVIFAGIAVYFILKSGKETAPAKIPEISEKTAEEISQALTAPESVEPTGAQQDISKKLSPPRPGGISAQEILKNLTPP